MAATQVSNKTSRKHFILPPSRVLKRSELLKVYQTLRKYFGHQHWWPGDTPFEIIIGAILTQNTSWTNVEKVIRHLKAAKALTPRHMNRIPEKELAKLIQPAGYFNVKADRLKHFLRFLFKEYRGNLERMFKEKSPMLRKRLLDVKGIGPETADSILLYAGEKISFVIDAYTRRIFARHRLLNHDKDYHAWQKLFEESLPRKVSLYNDFHAQIVALGKNYCKTKPRCSECPLRIYL